MYLQASKEAQRIRDALTASWVWIPLWIDADVDPADPEHPSGARLVTFQRSINLPSAPAEATIHLTADTRYKLIVNGHRVNVGPARSDPTLWFYDTIDIAQWLKNGDNMIQVDVLRYFKAARSGLCFARAEKPGLTVVGSIIGVDIGTASTGWKARVNERVYYPTNLIDDVFLHINERMKPSASPELVDTMAYGIRTVNGELSPWRLASRQIPLPEETPVQVMAVNKVSSELNENDWLDLLKQQSSLTLSATHHSLELVAEVHSTAFVRLAFSSKISTDVSLKLTYSEGYEHEPRQYPWLRTKSDRLDSNGLLLGPYDEVILRLPGNGETVYYEPFWFRTFRLIKVEIKADDPFELCSFDLTQINYPLDVKTSWKDADPYNEKIWNVSIRTMRNCMFDGYSDCPFYEQLMYSGDSRSVGLFHYLISGDDRLTRQAITQFATSFTALPGGGLTQSRFPSHVPQIIAGFPLYFILSICDHHLYFADRSFVLPLIPLIDGILTWFDSHVDELGLVSGISEDVWQYVDWVDTWGATDKHPDKGVPTAGRRSNRHTFFSMLYAYVLGESASLLTAVGRTGHVQEYLSRKEAIVKAIQTHCYDSNSGFFTDASVEDSTEHDLPYLSQHCQVFAVLCGAADPSDSARLLYEAFTPDSPRRRSLTISKCSYVMLFYAFRAFSKAGTLPPGIIKSDQPIYLYNHLFPTVMKPWRRMIDQNMTTWEEDDVRQRPDCHAWGSVPIYEFSTEIAGLTPLSPGWKEVLWKPRLSLVHDLEATICLGMDRTAKVSWTKIGDPVTARLELSEPLVVRSRLPGGDFVEHGVTQRVELSYPIVR